MDFHFVFSLFLANFFVWYFTIAYSLYVKSSLSKILERVSSIYMLILLICFLCKIFINDYGRIIDERSVAIATTGIASLPLIQQIKEINRRWSKFILFSLLVLFVYSLVFVMLFTIDFESSQLSKWKIIVENIVVTISVALSIAGAFVYYIKKTID